MTICSGHTATPCSSSTERDHASALPSEPSVHTVYLSLGTNLGDKAANLRHAIREIESRIGAVKARSGFLATDPWGFDSPHGFLNAAVRVATTLSPPDLLHTTQDIERGMGRTHKTENGQYRDRVIDIDILLYDDLRIDTPELTIPHPLMRQRDFVTRPLQEVLL